MTQVRDIPGGIHPPENKTQSLQRPIVSAGIPDELILPFSQHLGSPAEPVVQPGQRVLKGQTVARPMGLVSAPLHAPTSGEVTAIEERPIPHPSGMAAPCIVIRPDGREQWLEHEGLADYRAMDKSQLLQWIHDAGIAGLGGAGFPSAAKLRARDNRPIDTLIINGTECEPYITADDALMRERAPEIVAGVDVLRHLLDPAEQTLIGIEDNKPEAIAAMRQAVQGTDIDVVSFPTKYPSGGEKQLIQILTGREVPSGGLPADIGILCQNVGTCAAVHAAVHHGRPLISRVTTVTGEACNAPGNFEALLGTPIEHLLGQAGFDARRANRLVMGGPMMGFALDSPRAPIIKTTNCLLAPTSEELPPPPPEQACIRCGLCAEACPASLLPQQLYWYSRGQDYEMLEEHNLFDCIECGACSYVCPSAIPLVQHYRASKAEIRHQQQEKIKAEHARARFEARNARIARQEAEKAERRKARQQAARKTTATRTDSGDDKPDAIKAAIERSKAKKQAAATPAPRSSESE